MSERFHVKVDLSPGEILITGPEAHHLGTVCRVHPGDAVCLFNGDGHEYPARVVSVSRNDVSVEVTERRSPARESPLHLHIATPLPKGDRAQFLVEKLTELGVSILTVIATDRSFDLPKENKRDKLERYVVESSKQCGRNVLMQIDQPRKWVQFALDPALPARRYIAHPDSPRPLVEIAKGLEGKEDLVVAVGPEGGFSDEEVEKALAAGWQQISLGPRILRVETATTVIAARLLTF